MQNNLICNLLSKIEYLRKNNRLTILQCCGSTWQNDYISSLAKGCNVVDVSDPMVREQIMRQPDEFVRKIVRPAVFYNLQYAPELLSYLADADVPIGAYIAIVNQSYYIQSLVEQLEHVTMVTLPIQPATKEPFLPCAFDVQPVEYSSENIPESILHGKLSAESFSDAVVKGQFYANYLKNYLQRNIKDLTTVSDDMRFYRFLLGVASSTSRMVNYANLGNVADISSPTAKQWMAFLEGTGVVYLLDAIEHGSLKRVTKTPKVYFADTGLAAYLLRINSVEELNESAFFGALFENYVVNAIRDSYIANGFEIDLSYFRDSNAKEIDLLLRYNNVIYPIDIRREPYVTSKLRKKFRIINAAEQDGITKIGVGCVIGLGKRLEPLADDLWYIPVGSLD